MKLSPDLEIERRRGHAEIDALMYRRFFILAVVAIIFFTLVNL